jgi:ATP-binding cassette subfamily B protein
MGVVPQEVFLFSDTIANNILFGSSDKNTGKDKIEFAAKQAQVHNNIITFPEKYETIVGERGVTLSGGQKQRISIARALINKPQLLIFDDCLSAVDTETEEIILNNLKQEMENKTAIIVSHRISSLKNADLILYLKEGEILEMGTHEALLALKGSYFQLHQMQSN